MKLRTFIDRDGKIYLIDITETDDYTRGNAVTSYYVGEDKLFLQRKVGRTRVLLHEKIGKVYHWMIRHLYNSIP